MASPEEALAEWARRAYDPQASMERMVAEAARLVRDPQEGPLEGPFGPSGSGSAVRTASGRSMEDAAREGPVVPPTTVEPPSGGQELAVGGAASQRDLLVAAQTAERHGTRVTLDPTLLRRVAELLEQGTDRRVAEGRARRAAMVAARTKAEGGS